MFFGLAQWPLGKTDSCVDFIERELQKNELVPVDLERLFRESKPFSEEQKRKRLNSNIDNLARDNRQTSEKLLEELLEERRSATPLRVWK